MDWRAPSGTRRILEPYFPALAGASSIAFSLPPEMPQRSVMLSHVAETPLLRASPGTEITADTSRGSRELNFDDLSSVFALDISSLVKPRRSYFLLFFT